MMKLVLNCEELILEAKGISDLIGIIARAGHFKVDLENYAYGIELLHNVALEHYNKFEALWNEMYSEVKNAEIADESNDES